jgi:predicted DsbA family dithiol-disulfide isomerase
MMKWRGKLDASAIDRMAKKVGLDRQQLQRDMTDPATDFILNRTRRAASAFDLQGTPALIIGDNVIPGAISQSEILNLIKQVQADKNS